MSNKSTSIVIPNWNGEEILPACLTSLGQALERAGGPRPWEIIVADDGSTDGSLELLSTRFPEVKVVKQDQRQGFISSANLGLSHCTGDYVLMLNNDVIVEPDFFTHAMPHFEDSDVFAVTSRILRPDGQTFDSGRRVGVWERGLIRHWVVARTGTTGATLYGSGGATIYDRKRFMALGWFDPLYRPMYVEDLDICYCAWKRGWKVLYEPQALAYHRASYSSKRVFKPRPFHTMIATNHYLFIWKNITDAALYRQHLLWLPYWLALGWLPRRRLVMLGFFRALKRLPEALAKRRQEKQQMQVSDRVIWRALAPSEEDYRYSPRLGHAGTA